MPKNGIIRLFLGTKKRPCVCIKTQVRLNLNALTF